MLDAHPEIAITPETHVYTRCRPELGEEEDVRDVWRRLQQQPGFQDMAFPDEEVQPIREKVESGRFPGPPELLHAVASTYAARSGASTWGEKTPDHLPHVPTIAAEFPDARFISIVRDPRDVCLSLRRMPWSHDTLFESAGKWRRYAELSARFRDVFPDRFREIRYEDLLDRPESVLRHLLEWIGAPFDRAVLNFHETQEGPADADREPWKEKTHRPIDPSNKEKWRTQMGPAERGLVQFLTRPLLTEKGYPVASVSVDAAFVRDLCRVLIESAQILWDRVQQRWRTPERAPDDHRPTWIRRGNAN
jgi:hypothetical protein